MTIFNSLSEEKQELLHRHLELVYEANKRLNLTRIKTIEDGWILHVEDSLTALPEIQNAPAGLYGDMGSGAGYPGIPLAIVSERSSVLIEKRKKKAAVLNEIVDNLKLSKRLVVYEKQIEIIAQEKTCRFAALTARALAPLSVLMELASPLLKDGGLLICYKSQLDEKELSHALDLQTQLALRRVDDRTFNLCDTNIVRRIITFEKKGHSIISLPRHVGFAQKKPL